MSVVVESSTDILSIHYNFSTKVLRLGVLQTGRVFAEYPKYFYRQKSSKHAKMNIQGRKQLNVFFCISKHTMIGVT